MKKKNAKKKKKFKQRNTDVTHWKTYEYTKIVESEADKEDDCSINYTIYCAREGTMKLNLSSLLGMMWFATILLERQ